MRLKDAIDIFESFDRPLPWRKTNDVDVGFYIDQVYKFKIGTKAFQVNISAMKNEDGGYSDIVVDFEREDIKSYASKISLTGDVGGSDAIKVMATVMDIVKNNEHISDAGFFKIEMDRDESSRVSLYKKMIKRYAKSVRFGELGGYVVAFVKI